MHIVIVGAGAIGTLYGGWLMAGGGDVSFVARGAQLEALRARGLEIRGDRGGFRRERVEAAQAVGDLRPADVLVMAVKLYDLESAARANAPALTPGGLVVGLQNGVEASEVLGRVFAAEQVMVGPVYSAARMLAPGVVQYAGRRDLVSLGRVEGPPHRLSWGLVNLWREAGIEARVETDIEAVLWAKFLGLATNAALTCLARQAAGVVYHDPDLLDLARRSIAEVEAVALARGVRLPAGAAKDALDLLTGFPPDVVASMRQDLDAGRRLELDGVSGAIVRFGRELGVPTPIHDVAYACLKPYRDGVR